MIRSASRLALLLALGPLACGDAGDAPAADPGLPNPPFNESTLPAPDAPPAAPGADALTDRPATRTDTILIEGMPEPIRLDLFRATAITPGFSTYVPVGLEPETRNANVGLGIDFTARFNDVREPRARLGYFVYEEGMNRAQVNEQILGFTSGRRPRAQPESGDRFPWSLLEQRYEYEDEGQLVIGTIALGQRAGRYFHILIQYPAEYGDGVAPRVAQILRHWRWADDGSDLQFRGWATGAGPSRLPH